MSNTSQLFTACETAKEIERGLRVKLKAAVISTHAACSEYTNSKLNDMGVELGKTHVFYKKWDCFEGPFLVMRVFGTGGLDLGKIKIDGTGSMAGNGIYGRVDVADLSTTPIDAKQAGATT